MKEHINHCTSKAYVFVNQPGIRKLDFFYYKKNFIFLQRYIFESSSAIKFEKVDLLPSDTFDDLITYVQDTCHIDEIIKIRGNETDDFEPYIDVNSRILRIDFPALPENSSKDREFAIESYDKFLRYVLAQIPSPQISVIYTSLEPHMVDPSESVIPIEIFPEVFRNKNKVEKNDRKSEINPSFNEPRPKFKEMSSKYISIFDSDFVEENYTLLQLIVTTLVGFILFEFIFHRKDANPKKVTVKSKSKSKSIKESEKQDEKPAITKEEDKSEKSSC